VYCITGEAYRHTRNTDPPAKPGTCGVGQTQQTMKAMVEAQLALCILDCEVVCGAP
jgi:hypothetical protein